MNKSLNRLSMVGSCILSSSTVTAVFIVAATRLGRYSTIDVYLGSIWTFILSTIISSPVLIPFIRSRLMRGV